MVRPVIRVPAYECEDGVGPVCFGAHARQNSAAGSDGLAGGGSSGGGHCKPFSKVPSLLFDLEDLEDHSVHKQSSEQQVDSSVYAVLNSIASLLEPWSEAEHKLLSLVRLAKERAIQRDTALLDTDLADSLRRLGYSVKIRTALGGGFGGACLRNLRHTFLTITLYPQGGSGPGVQYILDPKFKEQFEVAHKTPRYRKLMEGLGQEVLATPDRIAKVVELLCHEVALAFAETGTPLPPWRQLPAMLSKWQPRRSEDSDAFPSLSNSVNNALGFASVKASLPSRYTSALTAAQRIALGDETQPLGPSPIMEGLEDGRSQSPSPHANSAPSHSVASSDNGSLHIGWPEDELKEVSEGCPDAQLVPRPTLQATQIDNGQQQPPVVVSASQRLQVKPIQHVWDGIKKAAASLPRQHITYM